jgi:hypothetical protein
MKSWSYWLNTVKNASSLFLSKILFIVFFVGWLVFTALVETVLAFLFLLVVMAAYISRLWPGRTS